MIKIKHVSNVWAAILVALAVIVASPVSAQQESKLYEVLKRGKVIVGVTSEVPPFGSIDNGKLVGFDIDIATYR